MKIWKTKNGNKIIQVLSGRSNAYLILIDSIIILVDTGKSSALKTLSKNIESLNITIDDVSAIILTHTHFDHCQSTKIIKEKSDCQIIVSGSTANSIKNGYSKLPEGTFLTTRLIAKLGRLMGKSKFGYEPFKPDIFVNGDYDLNISDSRIRTIETIGHSADSVSILVDNEIAIVGDVMFGVFKNSVFPPYSDDIVRMIESWGKLLNTDCRIFLPGHGKEISRNLLQKEYEKYARKHNMRFIKLLE
jgi:hydroxyacylglutathione hydrolase